MPVGWQWVGFWITAAGTVAGLAGLVAAIVAARRAKSAATAAREASAAAGRAGRAVLFEHLLGDAAELQLLIVSDPAGLAVAAKADALRGRLIEYRTEHAAGLPPEVVATLDRASLHLAAVGEITRNRRLGDASRRGRLQRTYGDLREAMAQAQGYNRHTLRTDRDD